MTLPGDPNFAPPWNPARSTIETARYGWSAGVRKRLLSAPQTFSEQVLGSGWDPHPACPDPNLSCGDDHRRPLM